MTNRHRSIYAPQARAVHYEDGTPFSNAVSQNALGQCGRKMMECIDDRASVTFNIGGDSGGIHRSWTIIDSRIKGRDTLHGGYLWEQVGKDEADGVHALFG